ncbi:hypothetical protein ACIPWY_00865 [Streptomyces sp. NPDC090032]|uniref:hypothetical protein n=1 Tax=unclassified Streptomyces TaxID=2593676 RepID=UPI00371C13D6
MERSSRFARFGARAAALLEEWQQQTHRQLTSVTWLDTGGSGALLASVFVRDSDPKNTKRRMIIKLCSPDGDSSMEPGRLVSARRSTPEGDVTFPREHLVEQLYDPMPVAGSWLMFQGFAGNDETMVTLSTTLRQRRLPQVAGEIARSLLAGWNPDEHTEGEMTAAEFVAEVLDRRLEPGGPLPVWVRDTLGLGLDTPWLALGRPGSAPLPNPVHLAASCALAGGVVSYPVRGRAHGDLHPGNIMVPKEPGADTRRYVLIDLSRFDKGALLARDPVHLLLCLVADFLPHLSQDARAELLGLLVGRDTPGLLIPQGLQWTVDQMRNAPEDWLSARTISGEWQAQWLLSMQACALMFTARARYGEQDRWWFFRLAAEAAGAYLRSVDAYEPGEAVFVPGPRTAEPQVVHAVVVTPKVPAQMAPPERPEAEPEVEPAPGSVRVPDPTPVRESPAVSPEAADGSHPDPETAAETPPDTLPALLIGLRYTFGRRLEALREQEAGSVGPESLGSLREQADEVRTYVSMLLGAAGDAVGEEDRSRVHEVRRHLARVARAANDPGFSPEKPFYQRDLAHRALVAALDTLLGSAREAALGLPAGQATDPIRPEGARAPSG